MALAAFRFLGSIKLAVPLLATIVGILIWATFYESQVGSALVQQEIYKSPWFGALMFLLAVNLGVSAMNRYPWRGTRKIGFALAHLGLIVLIAGSAAVIHLSVEGMLFLRTDQGASHLVRVDGELLDVMTPELRSLQTELQIKPDNTTVPKRFAGLEILGYKENTIRTVSFGEGAAFENPAVLIRLNSDRMGQVAERWLAAAPTVYQQERLGPVQLELITASSDDEVQSFLKPSPQSTTGRLGAVTVIIDGAEQQLDIESSLKQPVEISPGMTLAMMEFWPDFRLDGQNQPTSASQQLRNPAVQLSVTHGDNQERWFVFASGEFEPVRTVITGESLNLDIRYTVQPQPQHNLFQVISAPNGQFFYTAQSANRSNPEAYQSGLLELGKPVSPGWVDFQITLEQVISHAVLNRQVTPVDPSEIEGTPALQVATPDSAVHWLTWGEPTTLSDASGDYYAAFSPKMLQLPFDVELQDFIVERNEGSESVAMWTSQIQIQDAHRGELVNRKVWMNHPTWYQGWKLAQASWNPGDLHQSTLQVKREPWWVTALTWSGSILVVLGILVMFYGGSLLKTFKSILPKMSQDDDTGRENDNSSQGEKQRQRSSKPTPSPSFLAQD